MAIIKVLIADDFESIREKYRTILEKCADIEVCAVAKSGYEAVMLAALHKPDVMLMDIEMENKRAGLQAAEQILEQLPDIKIIIMTVYEDDDTVFSAFKLGICDYIVKNVSPAEITRGVRDAYNNRSPIRPNIATKIREEFRRVKEKDESLIYNLYLINQLTLSEGEIVRLLAEGKSKKEICAEKHVEPSTVKTHIWNISRKFGKKPVKEIVQVYLSLPEDLKAILWKGGE